jgi:hypothetical protein
LTCTGRAKKSEFPHQARLLGFACQRLLKTRVAAFPLLEHGILFAGRWMPAVHGFCG